MLEFSYSIIVGLSKLKSFTIFVLNYYKVKINLFQTKQISWGYQ